MVGGKKQNPAGIKRVLIFKKNCKIVMFAHHYHKGRMKCACIVKTKCKINGWSQKPKPGRNETRADFSNELRSHMFFKIVAVNPEWNTRSLSALFVEHEHNIERATGVICFCKTTIDFLAVTIKQISLSNPFETQKSRAIWNWREFIFQTNVEILNEFLFEKFECCVALRARRRAQCKPTRT